jgi:NAD(P)-dependent dehydrogenase (short-subunit alcohol dehydrogenase family)
MNIILTGSSTGIGRAIAEHLLIKGNFVWGIARSDQSEFTKLHKNFRFSRADVSNWQEMSGARSDAEKGLAGPVHAVIACAGIQGAIGPALELDPGKWSDTVRANLDGTYYAFRAFHSLLTRDQRAKLICFAGGGATKARRNFSAYGCAKTAIVRLVEMLAEELRDQPVDINAVAPGAINTRLTDEVIQLGPGVVGEAEYQSAVKQKAHGGASIEKALGLVDFLLAPESDGISGRLISAPWDPWSRLADHKESLSNSDIYTLRRIVPEERGKKFD